MGINVEFNPELTLRNFDEFKSGRRQAAECFPEVLEVGKIYDFLKKDQRNYWFFGEVMLRETKGNADLSRPRASVRILETTHFFKDEAVWTRGKYKVIEVFNDGQIHFEGLERVGERRP